MAVPTPLRNYTDRHGLLDAYELPRENDFFLMGLIYESQLSIFHKQVFNQIRMYMKVLTASDIICDGTNKLKPNIIGCKSPLKSSFGFPYIKPFPKHWINIWNSIIATIVYPRIMARPLRKWISFSHISSNMHPPAPMCDDQDSDRFDFNSGITSPKSKKVVDSIHKAIKSSPRWMRHVWGESKLTHKCIFKLLRLIKNSDFAIATDASVSEGIAGHAFCFASKTKGSVIFSSGSKVEGPVLHTNSYRAEMTSIIAATTLIDTILQSVGIVDRRIGLYTDSETSITTSKNSKLNTLHFVLSNDIDVAMQLHDTISTCINKGFL